MFQPTAHAVLSVRELVSYDADRVFLQQSRPNLPCDLNSSALSSSSQSSENFLYI